MIAPPDDFLTAAAAAGIDFAPGEVAGLGRYLALLYEANAQMNLTAVRDPDLAWRRHILDSLSLLPVLDAMDPSRILDVGSGGGLPGIPLSIVSPQRRFVLLEATGKKAAFLQRVVDDLTLGNVRVVAQRAEEAARHGSAHRGAFDLAIARAVGPLRVLLELMVPFLTVGGFVAAIKGERAPQELDEAAEAMDALRCSFVDTVATETGTIVLIRKDRATPRIYPRRPGEPKRRPLGWTEDASESGDGH